MSSGVEHRNCPELSGLEENTEQFSAFEQSNKKYTRAFLLQFCDAKVCGKLPPDFDLLTLRSELEDASEDKIEGKRTSNYPSLRGSLPSNRWNFDLPEKSGTGFRRPLRGQSGYKDGILVPNGQNSDLFQLRKSDNPYRSPHCFKVDDKAKSNASLEEAGLAKNKDPFLEKSQSMTVEQCETETFDVYVLDKTEDCVAQENSIKESDADQITGSFSVIDSSNRCSKTPNNPSQSHLQTNSGPTNLVEKTPELLDSCSEHGMGLFMNPCFSTIENDQGDSVRCPTEYDNFEYEFPSSDVEIYLNSILGECETPWTNKGGRDYVEFGMIKDNNRTSDDEWDEISRILQVELVYDHLPDSEIESHLPELLDFNTLDSSDNVANSDAELNLPDEDTLITMDDFIFPPLLTYSLNRNSEEANTLRSNLAAKITKNPEALNSSAQGFKVQPFLDVSGLVNCGKLHSPQSQWHDTLHSKMTYLHPGNYQVNFLNPFTTPNITRYLPPSLYCNTCSNTHPSSFRGPAITKPKANDSLVHYSLLQQPYICKQQQNQTLVDPACTNPIQKVTAPDLNTNQSDREIFQGFGKSNSGGFGDQKPSRMLNADKFYRGIPSSTTQPGDGKSLQQ